MPRRSDSVRTGRRLLVWRNEGRQLGETFARPTRGAAQGESVTMQALPFFIVEHPTLGAFPEDDSEAWVLG